MEKVSRGAAPRKAAKCNVVQSRRLEKLGGTPLQQRCEGSPGAEAAKANDEEGF